MQQQASARQRGETQRQHCLYVVFDSEEDLHQAEDALLAEGVKPQRIHEVARSGVMARIERLFMHLGEDLPGMQRYAHHRDGGRVVLSLAIPARAEAMRHMATLARHGGYDIAYFRSWTAEYLGPRHSQV